jgi:hypothetical protein
MNVERTASVYALRENGFVRYVGKTIKSLECRLGEHLTQARNGFFSHKCNWIRSMFAQGLSPTITILEKVKGDGCAAERKWIAYFKSYGIELTNLTDGGEGNLGWNPSPETRYRIGSANRDVVFTPERRAKMGVKRKGIALAPEHREHIRIALNTPEAHAKMSAAGLGAIRSDAARYNMSVAQTGLVKSPAHREALRVANAGHRNSDEAIERMRQTQMGHIVTDAQRAKVRASLKAIGYKPSAETLLLAAAGHRTPEARARNSAMHMPYSRIDEVRAILDDKRFARWLSRKQPKGVAA